MFQNRHCRHSYLLSPRLYFGIFTASHHVTFQQATCQVDMSLLLVFQRHSSSTLSSTSAFFQPDSPHPPKYQLLQPALSQPADILSRNLLALLHSLQPPEVPRLILGDLKRFAPFRKPKTMIVPFAKFSASPSTKLYAFRHQLSFLSALIGLNSGITPRSVKYSSTYVFIGRYSKFRIFFRQNPLH